VKQRPLPLNKSPQVQGTGVFQSNMAQGWWCTTENFQLFLLVNSRSRLDGRPNYSSHRHLQKIHGRNTRPPSPSYRYSGVLSVHTLSRAGQTTSHHFLTVTPTFKSHRHTLRLFSSSSSPNPVELLPPSNKCYYDFIHYFMPHEMQHGNPHPSMTRH
jgi:hypothetical protein